MEKIDRTGEVRQNKQGYNLKIVAYRNNKDIDVYCEETCELLTNRRYSQFKNGLIYSKQPQVIKPMSEDVKQAVEEVQSTNNAIGYVLGFILLVLVTMLVVAGINIARLV